MNRGIFLISVFFAIFTVITTNGYSASGTLLFSINSQNLARIGVLNNGNNSIILNISNKEGENVFTEYIKGGNTYFKLFDLSKLPDGQYKIKINGNNEEAEKVFKITKGHAELVKTLKEIPPKFYQTDELTFMFFYSNVYNHSVDITFEINNTVVFEDKRITGAPIKKSYSLKSLPKGKYVVFLKAGDKYYSYSLNRD
jgi:hypothetical protein